MPGVQYMLRTELTERLPQPGRGEKLLKDFTDHDVSCFLFGKTQHFKISSENGI